MPYDLAIALLDIYPKDTKALIHGLFCLLEIRLQGVVTTWKSVALEIKAGTAGHPWNIAAR